MRISKNLAALLSYLPIAAGILFGAYLASGSPSVSETVSRWSVTKPGHVFDFEGFRCAAQSEGAKGCTPVEGSRATSFHTMNACLAHSREWIAAKNDAALKGGCFEKLGA
jgi:hypothetical protein